jgi:hypothetical protein
MKELLGFITLVVTIQSCFAQAPGSVQGEILFSSGTIHYTKQHFEKIRRFAEFLMDQPLSDQEVNLAMEEAKKTFLETPQASLDEIKSLDVQM